MATTIQGDLLLVDADYIVHQCNCLTVRSHGLAKTIAERRPYADIYAERTPMGRRNCAVPEQRGKPGSIAVRKDVVCLLAQWRPGRVQAPYWQRYPESQPVESRQQRLKWFRQCLQQLSQYLESQTATVAFPYKIGCGLAGGNWTLYKNAIDGFAAANKNLQVLIVKYE